MLKVENGTLPSVWPDAGQRTPTHPMVLEDSADSAFVTATPAFSSGFGGGAALKILFPKGVAGQVFQFSSWLQY